MLNIEHAFDIHVQLPVGMVGIAGTTTEVDVEVVGDGGSSANVQHRDFGEPSGCAASHSNEFPSGTQQPSTSSATAANDAGHGTVLRVLRFTCDFCPSEFDSHEDMCGHVRKVHFVCEFDFSGRIFLICICGKVFFSKIQMDKHSPNDHLSEKCDLCPDKQEIKHKVYHHQVFHFQMYRYQCSRCLNRFKTQEDFESKKKHRCDCIRIPAWRLPTVTESSGSSVRLEVQKDVSALRTRRYLCGVKGCTTRIPREVPELRSHCRKKHNLICFEYQCRCTIRFDSAEDLVWHQQTCDKAFRIAMLVPAKNDARRYLDDLFTENSDILLSESLRSCPEKRGISTTANEATPANQHMKELENSQISIVVNKFSSQRLTPTLTNSSLKDRNEEDRQYESQSKRPLTL